MTYGFYGWALANFVLFIEALNLNDFNLSLTLNWHVDTLQFLDLTIRKNGPEGVIFTDLLRKDRAGNSLLHFQSAYPLHLIGSIPKGQNL